MSGSRIPVTPSPLRGRFLTHVSVVHVNQIEVTPTRSIGHDEDLTWWLQAVRERWPDTRVMTEGAFGLEWRRHTPNNNALNYRFDAKGTGAPGSEKELEIQWNMNRDFRLALLCNWQTGDHPSVIDFTRYDLTAHEPETLQREWSLMNVLNQKGTRPQDKPTPLGRLNADDQRRIYARYPELKILAWPQGGPLPYPIVLFENEPTHRH